MGRIDLPADVLDNVPRFGHFQGIARQNEIVQHVNDQKGFFFIVITFSLYKSINMGYLWQGSAQGRRMMPAAAAAGPRRVISAAAPLTARCTESKWTTT